MRRSWRGVGVAANQFRFISVSERFPKRSGNAGRTVGFDWINVPRSEESPR